MFQARSLVADLALLEVPSAVAPFYMTDAQDRSHLRTPAVAVAAGPAVYIYRNLRPYYKVNRWRGLVYPICGVVAEEVDFEFSRYVGK